MSAKLTATRPRSLSVNGLAAAAADLVGDPTRQRLIVAVVDVKKVTIDHDTGESVPTVRIWRVELVEGRDADSAGRLLQRAFEARTGQTVLDLHLEDELRSVRVDPETGEIR